MDRILIILKKKKKCPRGALGLNTIKFKHVYWFMKQISGERLQDHWSSGIVSVQTSLCLTLSEPQRQVFCWGGSDILMFLSMRKQRCRSAAQQ